MNEKEVTLQHEAAHIVAALFCGIGVMRASIATTDDGNPEGVEIAPAGREQQTLYSWCVFFRFPYYWEMEVLGQSLAAANHSCSKDLVAFGEIADVFWKGDLARGQREIDEDCKRIAGSPLVVEAVRRFAAALQQRRVLNQGEIYAIWQALVQDDVDGVISHPQPGISEALYF